MLPIRGNLDPVRQRRICEAGLSLAVQPDPTVARLAQLEAVASAARETAARVTRSGGSIGRLPPVRAAELTQSAEKAGALIRHGICSAFRIA